MEVTDLSCQGFKEITLLGQNVNSYIDHELDFADLLAAVANVDRKMRVRFMTSHPQNMSDKLIDTIAANDNICKYLHLPVQSGSDKILELMNRSYTLDHYLNLIRKIKKVIPNVSLSTDIITGFPTENENDHKLTLDLLRDVEFDGAYTFKYSPRENTKAWHMDDDVPEEEKDRRLSEIIDLQRNISLRLNKTMIGGTVQVLVEGLSKKSGNEFCGRTDQNKMVIFPKNGDSIGDYISIQIERANSATLFGKKTGHMFHQTVMLTTQEG
jgi:tRNA-2-methylthio-N6-dimethylallyladenosine synthase